MSPPKGLDRLEADDYVEAQVEFMVFPQKADDYYGPNQNMIAALKAATEPWALTLREVKGIDVVVEASTGKVIQTWPVCIAADKGTQAEFTVTGGIGYTPITIENAAAYSGFVLYSKNDDGTLTAIDQSSKVGRDWWQADYDAAKKNWDITYTVSLDTPGDARTAHRFVWRME